MKTIAFLLVAALGAVALSEARPSPHGEDPSNCCQLVQDALAGGTPFGDSFLFPIMAQADRVTPNRDYGSDKISRVPHPLVLKGACFSSSHYPQQSQPSILD